MDFELKEGAVVVVPNGRLFVTLARRPAAEDGETPWIARLRQNGNVFAFRTEDDIVEEPRRDVPTGGRIAFIPAGVRAGDKLVVRWIAPKCVCFGRVDAVKQPIASTQPVPPPYATA